MENERLETTCCVAGGGPAGVMLGYLLARAGVPVVVLEKHKDFFRDFRGDTVHPSTLELFHELGFLEEFLRLPHQKLTSIGGVLGDFPFRTADFRHVPTRAKFVALMPQWDFLDFLVGQARQFSTFDLRMEHEVVGLISDGNRTTGVVVRRPDGESIHILAKLVVGCDGRYSTVRRAAQLELIEFGVPIDVLWFRISRKADDPDELFGHVNYGKALVMINRGDYFQAGLIIRKGGFESAQTRGIAAFRQDLLQLAPYLNDRVSELQDWDQVKLLTVQINRLQRWYREGVLCIGDAAHAMSPAGGVGINLAIQDATATARLLAGPLLDKRVTEEDLARVQDRRQFPTRVTQFLQINAHNTMDRLFSNPGPVKAPWQFKAAVSIPGVQQVLGHVIGVGVRPEHVRCTGADMVGKRKILAVAACAGIATGLAIVAIRLWNGSRNGTKRTARPHIAHAPTA